jgi:amino acid adenylation domain-containing protein
VPPLTHAQLPIWVGQSLTPASPLYNMAFAFVFPHELRPDWFREAWRRVTRDSDALRSRLVVRKDGGAEMTVDQDARDLDVLDPGEAAATDQWFLEWCRLRSAVPFTPGGVLADSVLVRLGDGRSGWFLSQHHLIADAWSTRLVYERMSDEYAALAAGAPATLQPASSYYEAAAALPRLAGENETARAHWAARTAGAAGPLRLYGRSGRSASTASTRLSLELDAETSRALDQFCRRDGAGSLLPDLSRFAVFAALATGWLSRVTGETALSIDTPVGGRPTPAARRAIGLFIEMFPFGVQVSSRDSLSSLSAKCLDEAGCLLTCAIPGLGSPASGGSRVVLNFIPGAFGPFAGVMPAITWIHPGHGDRAHTLRLQVHDFTGSGRYTLDFDFNDEALPPPVRRRSLEHFTRLLDAALADPDRPLAAIDIRADDERRTFLALNETNARPLPAQTVVDMCLERARLDPDRIALRQDDREVTFGELLARSNAVAEALVREGVAPGDTVAIAGRRSILSVVGIMGILSARAAYVPLDPVFPAERLRYMVEDSGARIVLLGEGIDPPAVPPGVQLISIASLLGTTTSVEFALPPPSLDDLAYLLYTSGSTGRPKGVPIAHAGLADYLQWAERRYVRGDRLTFPLFTALTFDLTVTSLFLPLITGGTLEIYPESGGPSDTAVMDVVSANRVDFIKLTPSHLSLLRQVGLAGSRIRRMVVGGEDLKTSLAAAVTEQMGSIEIHNEYGPTEAVVGCVAHLYDPATDLDGSVPIGTPADHVQLEILNEALTPVPEGVPGELWISRHGLAHGYHRLPELTSERFHRHPDRPGTIRYRSGDLVRLAAPDRLEYLGRIDRQVKVAGHRIELAEVEAALLEVPQIHAGAAAIRRASGVTQRPSGPVRRCERCGLPSNFPRAGIDAGGLCGICRSYDAIRLRAQAYFKSIADLQAIFDESRSRRRSEFDCLMLYSGGKDSTYALCRLVELGLSVYAFTLDNGFLSESAKDNIRRVTAQLGVPLHFASTPGMNAIFRDSLARFSNVCNGCFKTIYTLGMLKARDLGIPIVVTGLSRGQMFETRLTPSLFADGNTTPEEVDDAVLAARKAYHRSPDAVSQAIDVRPFQDDTLFDQVRVVDFYRYCDVSMDELYAYLLERVPWVRPKDTGRSTNCLINDVGIYVHKHERGFHNYALAYSWDVRLGHKTRSAALDELDDDIDVAHVRRTLSAIGYDERRLDSDVRPTLEAFYVASAEIPPADLARSLGTRLPPQFVPVRFHRVDRLPLTVSGKVDVVQLLQDTETQPTARTFTPPDGVVQEFLAGVWRDELGVERVGADDSFFELGGSSLTGMQMMVRLCREYDIHLPLATVFSHPRLADLARLAEDAILGDSA